MAKGIINYVKYKGKHKSNANIDGKTFGRAQYRKTMTLDEMAAHMTEHNSVFSKGTVKGLLEDFSDCIVEQICDGNKVKIDGLGTFYVALSSSGADSDGEFTAQNFKKTRIRFTADQVAGRGVNAAAIRDKVTLQLLTLPKSSSGSNSGSGNSGDENEQPEP